MRIDIWDVQKPTQASDLDCGYARDFEKHFDVGRSLGKGGFGTVNLVIEKATGNEYACKSIKKRLEVLNVSAERQAQHLDNIDREATVLRRLRGTLSVAFLKGVWEDEENVHLVMEYCRGGELHHSIGQRVYTEETVARYLHQVLQCIAQCHHQRILHRDIKPGNFLLLDTTELSPIKAIDFGLAVFYDPEKLPRTDLGLEGTPWFMAPETLSSQTYPASDVWSAGVMCYQLLCGYLPFDDRRNPNAPGLSTVWHAILTEEPSMKRSSWKNISEEAKDFVIQLLNKDPDKRPTAKEALQHCWLQSSFHKDKSRPLSSTVVQRIQRFAQTNLLKRTVFELIAAELLKIMPPHLSDPSRSGGTEALDSLCDQPIISADSDKSDMTDDDDNDKIGCEGSEHGTGMFSMSPEKPAGSPSRVISMQRRNSIDVPNYHYMTSKRKVIHPKPSSLKFSPSLEQISALARAGSRTGAATVHGPGEYWRILRQASELAALESGHGRMDYLRATARTEDEKQEQRKAARLSLDTSAHGGSKYQEILTKLEGEGSQHARKLPISKSTGNLTSIKKEGVQPSIKSPFPTVADRETKMEAEDSMELGGRGRSAALMALKQEQGQQENQEKDDVAFLPGRGPITVKRVAFDTSSQVLEKDSTSQGSSNELKKSVVGTALGTAVTSPKDLESLMRNLQFKSGSALSTDALAHGLRQLGYDVTPAEMGVLLNQLGVSGVEELEVRPAEFVASLLDWGGFQRGNRELWLECARRAFVDLDSNSDGRLTAEDIIAKLRDKLPAEEVDFAVEDAFLDAGGMEPEDVDFEGFLRMMRVGSQESSEALELYDPRILETKRQEDGQEQYRLDPVLE